MVRDRTLVADMSDVRLGRDESEQLLVDERSRGFAPRTWSEFIGAIRVLKYIRTHEYIRTYEYGMSLVGRGGSPQS
jgi:hypothetical protein